MMKILTKFFVGLALLGSATLASAGFQVTSSCDAGNGDVQSHLECTLQNNWGDGSGVHSATLTITHQYLDNLNGADYSLNNIFVSGNTTECNSGGCPDGSETAESFDVTALLQAGGLLDQLFGVNVHDFGDWNDGASFQASLTVTVPEPGSLALFGLALAGLGLARRQRAK